MCGYLCIIITMKALPCAILTLLSLLLEIGAQTQASYTSAVKGQPDKLSSYLAASLTEANVTGEVVPSADADTTPFIGNTFVLLLMRDQLTITESAHGSSVGTEGLDVGYAKKIQDFATALDDDTAEFNINQKSKEMNPLLGILIGFIIEVVITLIVLRITFLLGDFRYHFSQVLPISLVVGFVGIFSHITLGISLFNPIQIALSSLVMLMMIRFITEAHEWADALKITFLARVVTIGLAWLAFAGMPLFGIYI
ncbi:MAG: hypothetical protein ACI9FZ_001291 [Bacteroidia bacterium]|jgi:hypothetical protein